MPAFRGTRQTQGHGHVNAGIFFLGYAALQIPSNLILLRVGAPTWLGITIVSWGSVAALFAAVRGTSDFYLLRFLLGITECGAFPGAYSPGTSLCKTIQAKLVNPALTGLAS